MATHEARLPLVGARITLDRVFRIGALPAVLLVQALLCLGLRNTAFQDEALYLYSGRHILEQAASGAAPSREYAAYFSGSPYVYPVIAGALDACCGLAAARALSVVLVLGATLAVYALARQMGDTESALFAAALFALQGPVLFIGHLATYDAMSVALLGAAAALAWRAGGARSAGPAAAAGLTLGLAVLTKYTALMWAPTVLFLLAWAGRGRRGWPPRVAVAAGAAGAVLVAALLYAPGARIGFEYNAFARGVVIAMPRMELLGRSFALGGGLVLVGLLGGILSGRARLPLSVVLLGSSLLAPAYHIVRLEYVSLHKHIAFGLIFAAPLAGYAVRRLAGLREAPPPRLGLAVLTVTVLLAGAPGLVQARQLYHDWPDSSRMVSTLLGHLRPGDRVLAEEMDVPRYYARDRVPGVEWSDLYEFEYVDVRGVSLKGIPAFRAAIAEGHFDLVALRYGPNVETARRIDDGLRGGGRYALVARIPHRAGSGAGHYWIWRKR